MTAVTTAAVTARAGLHSQSMFCPAGLRHLVVSFGAQSLLVTHSVQCTHPISPLSIDDLVGVRSRRVNMRGIQISAPRFKRNPREAAVATVAARFATATPVEVPSHSDIWGDIGDAVPKVPPAAADDDFGICSACGLSSVVCYDSSNKDDAGGTSDEHNNCYAGVARQQRGSPISRTNGESALVGAARRGATEAVRALLGAGATVNVASASGETALDTAMVNGQLSAALALVRAGATVSRTDDRLLRVATLRGDDELVSLLLQAGAPPLLARPATIGEPELLADEEEQGATSCLLLAARHPITRILSAYLKFFAAADDGGQVLLEAPHGRRHVTVCALVSDSCDQFLFVFVGAHGCGSKWLT